MIEVGTKLLLAEPGGWQVLSGRAVLLQLTALAWLLLGVPATTQAAAAAFKFFSPLQNAQNPNTHPLHTGHFEGRVLWAP